MTRGVWFAALLAAGLARAAAAAELRLFIAVS